MFSFCPIFVSLANFCQSHFHKCSSQFPEIGCKMFTGTESQSASTMSLSILVVIEMFNAMNALSSSESLISMPLWNNVKLIYAITLSMVLHFAILYTPILQGLFSIVPLNWPEWQAVLLMSAPVIIIDEALKFVERRIYVHSAGTKSKTVPVEANGKAKHS